MPDIDELDEPVGAGVQDESKRVGKEAILSATTIITISMQGEQTTWVSVSCCEVW